MGNASMSPRTAIDLPVQSGSLETGNVLPLLHEIRHALQRLIDTGEETVIDLRSIPLAPGEEARLEETLGHGEVTAMVSALGPSEIRETSIPGVWWVTHLNESESVIGKFIEITSMPSMLAAQREDILDGVAVLERILQDRGG